MATSGLGVAACNGASVRRQKGHVGSNLAVEAVRNVEGGWREWCAAVFLSDLSLQDLTSYFF